ncbi:hypothetical protein PFISCL1PPCAC_19219, partial [Pristionchus fissidentatus]
RVNRRLNRLELATKNRIDELVVTSDEGSLLVVVKELSGLKSINAKEKKFEDLKEGLRRIAMNRTCRANGIDIGNDINSEESELINIIIDIPANSVNIDSAWEEEEDEVIMDIIKNRPYPIFDQLDYNFLLSICEKRRNICIGLECDSVSVQEWIQIRQKMLSREISTTYLNVSMDESIASSILFAIHGVKFLAIYSAMQSTTRVMFFCSDDGKKILFNEPSDDYRKFSIHVFDGLLLTTFYAFEDFQFNCMLRFGMRLKWCENEE